MLCVHFYLRYTSKYYHRALKWVYTLGEATIGAYLGNKSYEMQVTTLQVSSQPHCKSSVCFLLLYAHTRRTTHPLITSFIDVPGMDSSGGSIVCIWWKQHGIVLSRNSREDRYHWYRGAEARTALSILSEIQGKDLGFVIVVFGDGFCMYYFAYMWMHFFFLNLSVCFAYVVAMYMSSTWL
jgi:hypothetical protein